MRGLFPRRKYPFESHGADQPTSDVWCWARKGLGHPSLLKPVAGDGTAIEEINTAKRKP